MTIYSTKNYRKIYERHYGSIPKDQQGRSYDIHHIDGNHSNNDISNLIAVSIQEHYDIHYQQKNWAACFRIAQRLKISPKLLSDLLSKSNIERVENGTHHFLGPAVNKKMLDDGVHPSQKQEVRDMAKAREMKKIAENKHKFQDTVWQKEKCRKAVENGNHNFLGGEIQGKTSRRRVKEGTHNFLRENSIQIKEKTHHFFGGEIQKKSNIKRLANGTHPSQNKVTCDYCHKTTSIGMHVRWHGENCKNKRKDK